MPFKKDGEVIDGQPPFLDWHCPARDIPSSALFEETGSPENVKARFESQFGKMLEEELIGRLEKMVKEVYRLV